MDAMLDIRYILGALRRRWLVIVLPAAFGATLSILVAFVLPPVYVSSARIVVESQQIPDELARSTVSTNAVQRIRLIEERLKTRQNLLDLANRYQAFTDRGELSPTEVVERMRQAATLRAVGAATRRGARADTTLTTFEISFQSSRAAVAAQIANELLTQVLAENTQQRSARASETLGFFTTEVSRLDSELRALEARIATFRTENQLALPENAEFRRTELAALQREVFAADARRVVLLDARRQLVRALELGQSPAGALMTPEQSELQRLRAAMAQQSAIYAQTHPTIRALSAQIAALEARVETALVAIADSAVADAQADAAAVADPAPELQRVDAELALLDEQQGRQAARIIELEKALAVSADIGAQLGALSRDHASLQAQYQQTVMKRVEAATGERLEVNQQAERFEIVERPQTPETPVAPNRPLIAAAGTMLSLGLGVALAALIELLNPAVRSARDVERHLGVRPIGVIPSIVTRAEGRRRLWMARVAVFAVLVLAPLGLWYVDQRVTPLSVLAEQAINRLGADEMATIAQRRLGF